MNNYVLKKGIYKKSWLLLLYAKRMKTKPESKACFDSVSKVQNAIKIKKQNKLL